MVTGFGSIVADVLMSSQSIKYNHKNLVDFQAVQVGGVIPTALMVLSRLGIETDLRTVLGCDEFGKTLLAILHKEAVRTDKALVFDKFTTPLAVVVLHKGNGQRTNFYTTGDFVRIEKKGIDVSLGSNVKLLLIDGHNINVSEEFIRQARKNKSLVLLDLGNPKKEIERLIEKVDVLVIPGAYWRDIWPGRKPEIIIRDLFAKYHKDVFLTMEEKGCLGADTTGVKFQPSFPVEAIDTNGAGDVFFGSLAYGYYHNWDLEKKLKFASAAASISCTRIGKDQKIPRLLDIQSLLKS